MTNLKELKKGDKVFHKNIEGKNEEYVFIKWKSKSLNNERGLALVIKNYLLKLKKTPQEIEIKNQIYYFDWHDTEVIPVGY